MRILLPILLLWTLAVAAAAPVELSISRTTCQPGDVVELRARLRQPEFAEFTLNIPEQDGLYIAGHEDGPVTYQNGIHSQQSTWILQPVRPGSLEIKGITATLRQDGTSSEIALTAPTLEILSYGNTEDSASAMQLPVRETKNSITRKLIWGAVAVITLLFLVNQFRRKPTSEPESAETPHDFATLRDALARGELPAPMIEGVLASDASLTPRLRTALDRALYAKSANPAELLEIWDREVPQ